MLESIITEKTVVCLIRSIFARYMGLKLYTYHTIFWVESCNSLRKTLPGDGHISRVQKSIERGWSSLGLFCSERLSPTTPLTQ